MSRAGLNPNYWYLAGQAYDLNGFEDQHPGGSDALEMTKGSDITELFQSYHFAKFPSDALLAKKAVSNAETEQTKKKYAEKQMFTFDKDGFYYTLRKSIQQYFIQNKTNHKAPAWSPVLALTALAAVLALYYPTFVLGSVFCAVIHGFLRGFVGITAGHAASHFSLFNSRTLNIAFFRWCAWAVLSDVSVWSSSHVLSHHVYTLTEHDLQDNYPVKRVQDVQKSKFFHSYQHIYIWFVYFIAMPLWILSDIFEYSIILFKGANAVRPLSLFDRSWTLFCLCTNFYLTAILPFVSLPFSNALLVFVVSNSITSMLVTWQIVVNHEVIDTVGVPVPNNVDWGEYQVRTSHNYGMDSALWLHLSGGLNYQIEHHLFPGMHFTHYPKIAPIVKKACEKYGLPYHTSRDLWEALYKHYQVLKLQAANPNFK